MSDLEGGETVLLQSPKAYKESKFQNATFTVISFSYLLFAQLPGGAPHKIGF